MTSIQYAEKIARESSVPCTLEEVEILPKEFYEEDAYGTSNHRCMDGDEMYVENEKGVATLFERRIDSRNRAWGSRVISKHIYYLKDYTSQ